MLKEHWAGHKQHLISLGSIFLFIFHLYLFSGGNFEGTRSCQSPSAQIDGSCL